MTGSFVTLFGAFALLLVAQTQIRAQSDFTAAFPEIPGCAKTVFPIVTSRGYAVQQAGYSSPHKGCGIISIQFGPGLKKNLQRGKRWFNGRSYKIRGFDVLESSSWCGVPTPVRYVDVYLSDNSVILFSQYGERSRGDEILRAARSADFSTLKRLVEAVRLPPE